MQPIIINGFSSLCAKFWPTDAKKFRIFSVEGAPPNEQRIAQFIQTSLILVTALGPVTGYDKASKSAHKPLGEETTLKSAALAARWIDETTSVRLPLRRRWCFPELMVQC